LLGVTVTSTTTTFVPRSVPITRFTSSLSRKATASRPTFQLATCPVIGPFLSAAQSRSAPARMAAGRGFMIFSPCQIIPDKDRSGVIRIFFRLLISLYSLACGLSGVWKDMVLVMSSAKLQLEIILVAAIGPRRGAFFVARQPWDPHTRKETVMKTS